MLLYIPTTIFFFLMSRSATDIAVVNAEEGFPDAESLCMDLLDSAEDCALSFGVNGTDDIYDGISEEACFECLGLGFGFDFYNSSVTLCEDATEIVCNQFTKCRDLCFPKSGDCQEEFYDYTVCAIGALYFGVDNCTVQCANSIPVTDGQGTGSQGNDSQNQTEDLGTKDSTSAASDHTMVTLATRTSLIMSMMLIIGGAFV
jgi:hypothetical protein